MTVTYTIDPAKVGPYKRTTIRNAVVLYGPLILLGLAAINRGDFSPSGLISMAIGGFVGALVLGLMTWSSLRTIDRQTATFQITMDDETISRETAGVPTVTLRLAEITTVEEFPGTGLLLRTADPQARLFIPEIVGEFPALRERLVGRWTVVRKDSPGRLLLRTFAWAALPAVLLFALWSVPTRPLVLLIGAILVGGAIWIALRIQRNPNSPRWYRLIVWVGVPLMIIITLQRLNALL